MLPSIDAIEAELASARERLKFVDDSIGRSQTARSAVFRDSKRSDLLTKRLGRKEEPSSKRTNAASSEKNGLPRSDLDASDLRQRLGKKRTSQMNDDSQNYGAEKRQKRYIDLDNPEAEKERSTRTDKFPNKYGSSQYAKPGRRDIENREDPERRPRITSHVIAPLDDRTRDDVVKQQGQDKAGKERNRRIFGALLGTLSRFQKEETLHKDQEDRRAQAEKKIEEKEKKEKQMMRLRKQELIVEKRKQELEVVHLQRKVERVREFEEWVKSTEYLKNFICTKKKPGIFYRPKALTKKAQQKMDDSAAEIAGNIMRRRQKLEEELLGMDEIFRLKCEDLSQPRTKSENERLELDAQMDQERSERDENSKKGEEEKGDSVTGENGTIEDLEQPESPKLEESPRLSDQEDDIAEPDEHNGDQNSSRDSEAHNPDEEMRDDAENAAESKNAESDAELKSPDREQEESD